MKLAVSALVLLGLLAALTLWRAGLREAAAAAAFPPEGQFVTVDGHRIHYVMKGSGTDLVLIHGASGSLRDFSFGPIDRLAQDYRVIAVDRPGLGHSDPLPEVSLAAQAHAIKAAMASLGVTKPVVLGQSYGGAVALAWALEGGPRALVLVSSPSLPWPGKLDIWYRLTSTSVGRAVIVPLVSAFVPQSYVIAATDAVFAPDPVPPGYDAWIGTELTIRRATLATNVAQVNALRAELVTMEPRYGALTLPVELVHGDADTIVPIDIHSRPLSRLLPNATLTVLPGTGHMPQHSHPDAVIAAIARAALR
ncbi:MAG: alpha/beta hydrolase [Rhodobacterales bacterium]|nr:alpha/beta hydrolase [Rhodobacterales bacterium]